MNLRASSDVNLGSFLAKVGSFAVCIPLNLLPAQTFSMYKVEVICYTEVERAAGGR